MAGEQPLITVSGERIALGPMRRDLIPIYQGWINNIDTTMYFGNSARPITLDEEIGWFEGIIRNQATTAFTVYRLEDFYPIGVINMHDIDLAHRHCELGVMIGELQERHKGFGTEAVHLMLDYAFNVLNLHSVMLETYAFNHAGMIAYERAGFRELGRRREARFHAGKYWDIVLMDVLASEFEDSVLKDRLTPLQGANPSSR